jgi:cysteine desulfurase
VNDNLIYLDHAAGTPLDARVLEAMQPYFSELFFNPSSPYAPAIQVRRDYEQAKSRIAVCIGGKADDLVMTAGATESINIMFGSVDGHVVTSSIEHQAVLEAAKMHDHTFVEPDEKGRISADSVAKAIRPDTELVSIHLANNELGTVQPLRDIAEAVRVERQRRALAGEATPIYFHSDASQGLGQIDVHVARLGVDALTLNAGKIYGPKQVGCLWTDRFVRLRPLVRGGGQERGVRSGTENIAGTIGFAAAIELATQHAHGEAKRLAKLRDSLESELIAAFPDAVLSGARKKRLPGHLHISFPGLDAERLIFLLEMQGVLVATGSACAANKGTRSHVLTAIKLAPEIADGSLRITLGRLTDESNIAKAAAILKAVITGEVKRVGK